MNGNLTITGLGTTVLFGLSGDSQATRSAAATGGGGWQLVDRPRSKVATEWTDVGQWQLTMNLIMDGYYGQAPVSLEQAIAVVESWEDPAPGSSPPLPPRLTVSGPVPHNEVEWVVYTLTWGDAIRDSFTGERYYQELQIVLWQYVPPELSTTAIPLSPAAAARAAATAKANTVAPSTPAGLAWPAKPPPSDWTYTVKAGQTLLTIATLFYGSYTWWTYIAVLNGIRDPRNVTPGQVLHMPTRPTNPGAGAVTPTKPTKPKKKTAGAFAGYGQAANQVEGWVKDLGNWEHSIL